MHWFDRVSQQVAEADGAEAPTGATTRRSVLKGATLAATLALPFVPETVSRARAANPPGTVTGGTVELPLERLPLETTSEFCNNCLERSYGKHDQMLKGCGSSPSGSKRLLKPKAPPKAPGKKTSPSKAAKQAACQAKVMKSLNKELEGCRMHFCEGDSEDPAPASPGAAEPGAPTCPGGTTLCSQTLCCYGGDACCVCASTGGFICCAAVVGCGCC
jgi:hypothetical protein